ncbi:MAG: type II toxin-antitoxin system HicA family toxin [Hyphomicrobiaceae bacterium]|nr:MAG: type II toxin-antitoxin system HicA family toxin [Hyphomicrobiaceae bacterium]
MSRFAKLIEKILRGKSDAAIGFDELRKLLLRLGFEERSRGSHHIFRKQGVEERLNLQRDGKNAKPYQVRQMRTVLLRYRLEEPD